MRVGGSRHSRPLSSFRLTFRTGRRTSMPTTNSRKTTRRSVTRRDFLERAAVTSVGVTALATGAGRPRDVAAAPEPHWDPPVIAPRLTQSVGLFQFAGLTSNRLLRYAFADEATGYSDLSLKGDL